MENATYLRQSRGSVNVADRNGRSRFGGRVRLPPSHALRHGRARLARGHIERHHASLDSDQAPRHIGESGCDPAAANLLPHNDCPLVVEADQMQGVLACIDANGVSCSATILMRRRIASSVDVPRRGCHCLTRMFPAVASECSQYPARRSTGNVKRCGDGLRSVAIGCAKRSSPSPAAHGCV